MKREHIAIIALSILLGVALVYIVVLSTRNPHHQHYFRNVASQQYLVPVKPGVVSTASDASEKAKWSVSSDGSMVCYKGIKFDNVKLFHVIKNSEGKMLNGTGEFADTLSLWARE